MTTSQDVNKALWDDRAPVHAASPGYAVAGLVADPQRLSHVVAFDLPRLGRLDGLDVVHLQCHIGTDTLSLSRLGAGTTTGLDLSPESLRQARAIAERAGADITYVESDVAHAVQALGAERFDVVYTGIGALCWLPSAADWARTVAGLLRPGGRLHLREGHPMLWAMAEPRLDGLLVVEFPYFERVEPLVWTEDAPTTYVEVPDGMSITAHESHEWNHGFGEIVTGLLDAGMVLTMLVEHDSVPWNPLGDAMALGPDGEYRLREHAERLPLTYTLQAVKPVAAAGP